jgi:hypothetical protein
VVAELKAISMVLTTFLGLAASLTYLGLVALGYVTEGPRYHFKFDLRDPLGSAKRLLVGLGVRLTGWTLHLGEFLMTPLFEASAEVGDWIAEHSGPETREHLRSRFM